MKGTTIRKAGAAALAGAMVLSCASCALFGANKKEIVEAADTFADTLLKKDAGKIIKLTNEKKDSDAAEALEMLFDESWYSEDQNKFNDAVADTITYEVDEESVEVDKEEASVDVTFTMVDYEKALKDDYSDIDEVLDLLDDCEDTKEVTVTFEFEKDDDEWLLSNLNDKGFGKIFDFYMYELELTPDLLSMIESTDIFSGYTGVYSTIYFTEDISAYEDLISFDVYCDGSLIASDMEPSFYGDYIYCDYYTSDYSDIESGDYEIVVKCGGNEITTMEITVDNYEAQPVEPDPTTGEDIDYDYSFDADGELGDLVQAVDWYLDDGSGYYSFDYGIEYDIYFSDELTYDDVVGITFNIYDEDGNTLLEEGTVYGSNISYGTNADGYYYVYLPYQPEDSLASGTYYIEVFNPDGTTLMMDYCVVL